MSEIRPTSDIPRSAPASVLRPEFGNTKAPSEEVPGMPFNYGEQLLPHVVTFQGIVSTVSRVYRYYDEAMKASLENARFMRNDLMIMEPVEQRRRACALLNWHIEVDDPDNPTEKQLAEDLTKIIKRIPQFTKMRECLLDAVWFGKYATQWNWKWASLRGVTPVNGLGQNMVVDRWKPLHGDKVVFRYDDGTREYDPNQIGIRVGAGYTAGDKGIVGRLNASGRRKVEPTDYGLAYFLEPWERKLLAIHKHMIEDGEYEDPQSAGKIHGLGIRSRIYWTWYMKQEIFAYLLEFLERSSTGIEIWYYPAGNPEAEAKVRKAAEDRLGNSRNVILMPRPVGEDAQAFGIEIVQPNIAGIEALRTLIDEYFGNQIMRYVLGQTMTNKPQSAGLGSDLPQIQLGSYLQIIRYDAINLGETLTTDLVDIIKSNNYPHMMDIPARFVVDTESEDVKSKLDAWKMAYDCGIKTKASDWLKMIGASKPEEDDETIQNPVVQQQDRLYQQFLQHKETAAAMGMTPEGTPQPGEAGAEGGAQVQGGLGEEPGGMPAETFGAEGGAATEPSYATGEPEPSRYSLRDEIDAAAAQTDLDPSDAAKAAGNYRKGKVRVQGLEIAIENPKGSIRRGKGANGKPWEVEMKSHYGYIKTTESEADGDHVDVFLGPEPKSEVVFVVNQTKAPGWSHFDEHKAMVGWHNAEAAKQAYLDSYSEGWRGFDGIVAMTMPEFKAWLAKDGSTAGRAVSKYAAGQADRAGGASGAGSGGPDPAGLFAAAGQEKPVVDRHSKHKPDAGPLYSQLLARYYRASTDDQVERFWAGETDQSDVVVIQDGRPMRYSRRHGAVSASYVNVEV